MYLSKRSFVTGYLSDFSSEDWKFSFFVARRTSLLSCPYSKCRRFPLANQEPWGSASMSSELLEYVEGEAIMVWKQRRWKANKKSKSREAGRRSNSTASSTEVGASRRGIGFLSAGQRVFKLKKLTNLPLMMKEFWDIPFHKDLLGHVEK